MAKTSKITAQQKTVRDAVSDAFSDIQNLAEEVREVADNLEEKFSSTQRYQTMSDTADTLESNCDEPSIPDELADLTVTLYIGNYGRRGPSRGDRRDEAAAALDAVITLLQERIDAYEVDGGDEPEGEQTLLEELENAKGEWEAVEFPGMRG